MTTRKQDSVSLLSQRAVDFLDLIAPQWQSLELQRQATTRLESLQALVNCNLSTLGNLSTVTPLVLLAFGAKIASPPAEGTPFWEHLLQQERDAIRPLLQTLLIEQINTALSRPQKSALHQLNEIETNSTEGETGYSSLLIQPAEVIDQWAYPDSITIVNWPLIGKRQVNFAVGEIRATPLLAKLVRDALRAAGYNLSAMALNILPLSTRTFNACFRSGDTTLEALTSQTPEQLMTHRNFGMGALQEVLHALRDYLLPRLESVAAETLVPPEHLNPFQVEVEPPFHVPSEERAAASQEADTSDNIYSSLFIKTNKVLEQVSSPSAPIISLYTPAGKSQPIHFAQGEVKATTLLAAHVRKVLRDSGCDLRSHPLTKLALSGRAYTLLTYAGITTLEQLAQETPETLLSRRGFGANTYQEVAECFLAYLTPWLAHLSLATLVPERNGRPATLLRQPDERGTVLDKLAPNQGKNALFFPVDAVLSTLGRLPVWQKEDADSNFLLSLEESIHSSLLSNKLIAALASAGCDLTKLPLQQIFSTSGTFMETAALRAYNALRRTRIHLASEVIQQTPADLLNTHNFGGVAYRTLIQQLQDYLSPWLQNLGINPATGEGANAYEDPPPVITTTVSSIQPAATVKLSEVFSAIGGSDLFSWLEYFEVDWHHIRVEEACDSLQNLTLPVGLLDLTFGDLDQPSQMPTPEMPVTMATADQIIANIRQILIARLVERLIQAAPSSQDWQENLQVLALVSVESLLAETLNHYIPTKHKASEQNIHDLPREMIVLLSHSGILGGQPKTLDELAATFHITKERVRQLELRAEDILRKGAVRPFVEGLTTLVKWTIRDDSGVTTVSGAAQRVASWLPFGRLDPAATIRLLVKLATKTSVNEDARLVSSSSTLVLLDVPPRATTPAPPVPPPAMLAAARAATPPPAKSEKLKQEFSVGEQVKHRTYGTGTVIKGSAAFSAYHGNYVQVDFGRQFGKRYFDLQKEPLEKISPATPVTQPKPSVPYEQKPKQEFFATNRVWHPTYGLGTVVRGTIAFQGNFVEVDFDQPVGKKLIDLRETSLEKAKPGWQPPTEPSGPREPPVSPEVSRVPAGPITSASGTPLIHMLMDIDAALAEQEAAASLRKEPPIQPAAPSQTPSKGKRFFAGDQVRHPIYGIGKVLNSSLAAGSEFVLIDFAGQVGIKSIDAEASHLQKVQAKTQSVKPTSGNAAPTQASIKASRREFFAGDHVKHPMYGGGKVVRGTIAFQNGRLIEVDFGGQIGKKTLDLDLVHLEKVSNSKTPGAPQPEKPRSAVPQEERTKPRYSLDDVVKHPIFGTGRVVSSTPIGRFLEVDFRGRIVKMNLDSELARMEKIQTETKPTTDNSHQSKSINDPLNLANFFREKGIEVIDERAVGGVLWVIGGSKLWGIIKELEAKKVQFKYRLKGSPATRYRSAWYTQWPNK